MLKIVFYEYMNIHLACASETFKQVCRLRNCLIGVYIKYLNNISEYKMGTYFISTKHVGLRYTHT